MVFKKLVVGKRYYLDPTRIASGVYKGVKDKELTFDQPLNNSQYVEDEGLIKFHQFGKDIAYEKNFPPYEI